MKHIHLIGIGGTGLSAIARVLHEQGFTVTGSDMELSPLALSLIELGISVFEGHRPENIANADLVIRSSAIPDDNPEVLAAGKVGIQVLKRRDFLPRLLKDKEVIAVAGSHGKTTTTSMIAYCMSELGQEPSFIVGSEINELDKNAQAGKGRSFVIEADEYDYMFLGISPDILVITNIEHDHPDCFPTENDYLKAFRKSVSQIKTDGTLIVNLDDPGCRDILDSVREDTDLITYGLSSSAQFFVRELSHKSTEGVTFSLEANSQDFTPSTNPIKLAIPGVHNALNATAALIAMHAAGVAWEPAARTVERFRGTDRRFEIVGEHKGIIFIDDYGHHPTEIKTTLAAARAQYSDKKIWTVWQPHTYSRTQQLKADFIQAFKDCDHLMVTEIYRSREPEQDYSSQQIVDEIEYVDAIYHPTLESSISYLKKHLKKDSVLIVFSAGDAVRINSELIEYFAEKEGI